MPASRQMLVAFLDAFPATRSTQVARLAVILAVHEAAGLTVETPRLRNPPDTLWTPREGLLDPPAALTQLPRYRFPAGLVGRRDGFLIVVTGILGHSRQQARQLAPADISIMPGMLTVQGREVPAAQIPGECPRCAVAGWLQVLAPHYERLRSSYLPLLDPTTAHPELHTCEKEVGVLWREGVALLPSIDRTGALGTTGPLSVRTITTIIRHRRTPTGWVEKTGPLPPATGRYKNATPNELAAAQDDVLDQIEQANTYLQELLTEAAAIKETLQHGGVDQR